mgnify:CR=1 FL=1
MLYKRITLCSHKKLPNYGIYGLVYLSGCSILYGNEFFSKGAPSISIDIVAYSIMVFSLLSFLSIYLLIEKLQKSIGRQTILRFSANDLLVIKKPPTTAPTINLFETTQTDSYLEDRTISFAYRYEYENGEYSSKNPNFLSDIRYVPWRVTGQE